MKKFLNVLLWVVPLPQVLAQPTYFNKTIDHYGFYENGGSVIVTEDSCYLVVGNAVNINPYFSNLLILKVTQNGDTLFNKAYHFTNQDASGDNILSIDDTSFLVVGPNNIFEDSLFWSKIIFCQINLNGDTQWVERYGPDTLLMGSGYTIRTSDGNFLSSGYSFIYDEIFPYEQDCRFQLMKVDPEGNLIWDKRFNPYLSIPAYAGEGWGIIETSDHKLIQCGWANTTGPPMSRDRFLLKYDSAGNNISFKKFVDSGNSVIIDLIEASPNHILCLGFKTVSIPTISNFKTKIWMGEVDTNLIMQWEKTYGKELNDGVQTARIIRTTDGNFVIAGGLYPVDSSKWWGLIMKVTADGDSLWMRTFEREQALNHTNFFYDVKETPDHGFILCGTTWDSTQNVWLVKTDSLGCDVPGCDTIDTAVQPVLSLGNEMAVVAFPNPSNEKFYFKYRLPEGEYEAVLYISDAMGREIWQQALSNNKGVTSWSGNNYPVGAYLFILKTLGGKEISGKLILQ